LRHKTMSRPTASVQSLEGKKIAQVALPAVFTSPIRADIIQMVHTNLNKNARQAYAVSTNAGHQTAAESWGTGRAVSRIPRVTGGGTHRAGQAAFGNMCRGGHMFGATKTWRRWHRRVNIKTKRYAVCSAIAATAVPALVMARGHRVAQLHEVPVVVDDSIAALTKTKAALAALAGIGAMADINKSKDTKTIRSGKGKWRNRRYVIRRGPLLVTTMGSNAHKAFRNIPGVEIANVEHLNLLQLAPGGHMGRFCIWTKSAFEKLDAIYGTAAKVSTHKKGWKPPTVCMANSDLSRLINDDAIQSVVRPAKKGTTFARNSAKVNPLKNRTMMAKLNPAFKPGVAAQKAVAKKKARNVAPAAKKAFYKQMVADCDYQGDDYDEFAKWLVKNTEKNT